MNAVLFCLLLGQDPPPGGPAEGERFDGQDSRRGSAASDAVMHRVQPHYGGFKLADTELGSVSVSIYTYARYLNQKGLDSDYTDDFGRTRELDRRQDIQLQKVKIDFKGWFLDPPLTYDLYVWTANTTMGQGAQVVVAGNLTYVFDDLVAVGAGINPLPATRSLEGSWPRFHKVDSRTMADEFFRGSYTTGVWARGTLAEGLDYKVMLGNNLSQLGVDSGQLDDTLDTVTASLAWLPTTGEYGPWGGMGDLEFHERVATRVGFHYTHSTEERQSQPATEDPENTQVRLSDGTIIFDVDALAPGTQVTDVRYQMVAADVGLKYRGFSFEAEYFFRWLADLQGRGPFPIDDVFDHGFQIQTSYMLARTLQVYVSPSKIFGEHGDPWDVSVGTNWYPVTRPGFERQFRINAEAIYLKDCPTGNSSVPFIVGANGVVFSLTAEFFF